MKVNEIMTHNPQCCSADDSLQKAASMMWTQDVGSLPVVDGSGRVRAMVTDRDILMHAGIRGGRLADLRVSGCMSGSVWSCGSNDTLAKAEKVMKEHQVHRLPVIDDGELKGIVTLRDIARAVGDQKSGSQAVAQTYGAIARARSTQLAAQ